MTQLAPYDTGNLALNAIEIKFVSPRECKIRVDETIAPYMPFTNETWISPRWQGAKNPNESWWNRACEFIAGIIADLLGGELKKQ